MEPVQKDQGSKLPSGLEEGFCAAARGRVGVVLLWGIVLEVGGGSAKTGRGIVSVVCGWITLLVTFCPIGVATDNAVAYGGA